MVGRRYARLLATLLPVGTFGISVALAATLEPAQAASKPVADDAAAAKPLSVATRLYAVRAAMSAVMLPADAAADPDVEPAQWRNWPNWNNWNNWRNGWGNGGWRNGGWGNGGWRNAAPGWHNWHNFWRNW